MYDTKIGSSIEPHETRDRAAVEMYLKNRVSQKVKPQTAGADYSKQRQAARQNRGGCVILNRDDSNDRRFNFLSAF
jgi:hypothetical protein